jgi:hypothetical protein
MRRLGGEALRNPRRADAIGDRASAFIIHLAFTNSQIADSYLHNDGTGRL